MLALRPLTLLVVCTALASRSSAQVNERWVRTFDASSDGDDTSFAVGFDAQGDVIAVGSGGSQGFTSPEDAITLKYSSTGTLLWSRASDGHGFYDENTALAIDPNDSSIYCAGRSVGSGTNYARVLHYDAAGTLLWSSEFGGNAIFVDCALESNGDLVAAGLTSSAGTQDFLIVRLAPGGSTVWSVLVPFSAGLSDFVRAMAIDANGDIYATGAVNSTGPNQNVGLAKISASGALLWQREFTGTATGFNQGQAIAVGPNGDVYVAGTTTGIGTGNDGTLLAYDPSGNLLWMRQPSTPFGQAAGDFLNSVAVEADGRVHCCGGYLVTGVPVDVELATYDPAGNLLWQFFWDSPGSGYDSGGPLFIDAAGNSVVLDTAFFTPGGAHSVFTLRLDRDGNLRNVRQASVNGFCLAGALDADGSFAIGGRTEPHLASDMLVILERPQARVFCTGDGIAAQCPCGNASLPELESGCVNSQGSAGKLLDIGAAHLGADSLQLYASGLMANGLCILAQGSATHAPAVFGDGVFCLGGTLKRMYVHNSSAGTLLLPAAGDASISSRSAQLGDPLVDGDVRSYQLYYRDPSTIFCNAATFNSSNGLRVEWLQ